MFTNCRAVVGEPCYGDLFFIKQIKESEIRDSNMDKHSL